MYLLQETKSPNQNHMMIHVVDETCPPGSEFRIHVYYSKDDIKEKLEPGLIVRLVKLKVCLLSIILLIREAKTLDPFLRKLHGRRSVKFGTVIHYKEE